MSGVRWLKSAVVSIAGLLLTACGSASAGLPSSPSSPTPAPVSSGAGPVLAGVTYCTPGGVPETMNLFLHTATGQPAPAAIYVHGGGWEKGDAGSPSHPSPIEAGLVSRGFVVAAINYRLAPQDKWPAQIEDVKCAVRYLRAHALTYGIDPTRIGAWGGSAGGHLVSMLGTAGPSAGYDVGQYLDQSSRVQAVVDMWGPADLTAPGWGSYAATVVTQVFGVAPGQGSSTLAHASPVTFIQPDDPPFLIVQGAEDPVVPASQSQELYQRLRDAGVDATLVMVEHAGHGLQPVGGSPSPSVASINQSVIDFFVKSLHA